MLDIIEKMGFQKRNNQQKLTTILTAGCSVIGGLMILRYLFQLTSSAFKVRPPTPLFSPRPQSPTFPYPLFHLQASPLPLPISIILTSPF